MPIDALTHQGHPMFSLAGRCTRHSAAHARLDAVPARAAAAVTVFPNPARAALRTIPARGRFPELARACAMGPGFPPLGAPKESHA